MANRMFASKYNRQISPKNSHQGILSSQWYRSPQWKWGKPSRTNRADFIPFTTLLSWRCLVFLFILSYVSEITVFSRAIDCCTLLTMLYCDKQQDCVFATARLSLTKPQAQSESRRQNCLPPKLQVERFASIGSHSIFCYDLSISANLALTCPYPNFSYGSPGSI